MKTGSVLLSFISISALTALSHAEVIDGIVTKPRTDVSSGILTYEITNGSTLIFENNNVIESGGAVSVGGGVFVATPDNTDGNGQVIFQNNHVESSGGAIYNTGGNVSLENAVFENNSANVYGGAIVNVEGTLTIRNAIFQNNRSLNALGGAIFSDAQGGLSTTAVITDSSFLGNSATFGGAICSNQASLSIFSINKDVVFAGNTDSALGLRANAIRNADGALYLAANDGRQLLFRDPVASLPGQSNITHINSTDGTVAGKTTGRVTFSGQDFSAGSVNVQSAIAGTTTVYGGTFELRDAAEYGVNTTGTIVSLNDTAILASTASGNGITNILATESLTLEEGSRISIQDATTLEIQNANVQFNGAVSIEFIMNENGTAGLGLLNFAGGNLDLMRLTLIIDVGSLDLSDAFWKSSWATEIIILDSGMFTNNFADIETTATGGAFHTEIDNGSLRLVWVAVPESSSYAMILGLTSFAGLLVRRKRK